MAMSNSTYPSSSTGSSTTGRDAADALHDIKEKGMQQASRLADKASDTMHDVADRVVEQGRDAAHHVQDAASTIQSALGKSLKEQPMTTLAVAAAVGFVLGALWKS